MRRDHGGIATVPAFKAASLPSGFAPFQEPDYALYGRDLRIKFRCFDGVAGLPLAGGLQRFKPLPAYHYVALRVHG
jgi:hypothetical protein